jgi:hypothetical protein
LAHGGPSRETTRLLDALADALRGPGRKTMILDPRKPVAGTRLVRKWDGDERTITVLRDGFDWQGRKFMGRRPSRAVPVPVDAPPDADALRDDIAANLVPAINDNLADLQEKVNGMPAALQDRGGSRSTCFGAVSAEMSNGQVHRVLRALCSQAPIPLCYSSSCCLAALVSSTRLATLSFS